MPLPAERLSSHSFWGMSSPLLRALWWVALLAGRASIAPLTIEGYLWACRSLLSVWVPSHSEEWVLRSPELVIGRASITPLIRGSSLSMPLPAERLSFPLILRNEFSAPPSSVISLAGRASIAPLTIEGYLWACRSLLSVWVPSHSEEWGLRSPELVIGRASIAPLIRGSSLSMPLPAERLSFPLILRNEFSAPPSSVICLAGRASIAPLTIEGYLWACRSLLSGEFPLILRNEFPALQSSL